MGICSSYFCLKRGLNRVWKGVGISDSWQHTPTLFHSKCPPPTPHPAPPPPPPPHTHTPTYPPLSGLYGRVDFKPKAAFLIKHYTHFFSKNSTDKILKKSTCQKYVAWCIISGMMTIAVTVAVITARIMHQSFETPVPTGPGIAGT